VRSFLESTNVKGVLTDPTAPSFTVYFPDGTNLSVSPVQDSTGEWHADYVIPFTINVAHLPSKIAVEFWRSQGVAVGENATKWLFVEIEPLPFAA
jgi:hypothetical protein